VKEDGGDTHETDMSPYTFCMYLQFYIFLKFPYLHILLICNVDFSLEISMEQ